jgi:hypothetical protein
MVNRYLDREKIAMMAFELGVTVNIKTLRPYAIGLLSCQAMWEWSSRVSFPVK